MEHLNSKKESDSQDQFKRLHEKVDMMFEEIIHIEDKENGRMKTVIFLFCFIYLIQMDKNIEHLRYNFEKKQKKSIPLYDYFIMIMVLAVRKTF